MILSGLEIQRLVEQTKGLKASGTFDPDAKPLHVPAIDITPFDPKWVGANSYDIHITNELRVYRPGVFEHARQAAGSGQPLSPQFAGVYHKLIDGLLAAGQPVGGLSGPVAVREVVDAGVKAHETFPLEIPADGLVLYPGVTYLACTREVTETYGLVPRIDGRSSVGRLGMFVHVTAAFGDDGFCGPFTLELAVVQPLRIPQDMRCAQISYTEVKGKRKPYAGRYQKAAGAEASKYAQ